MSRSLNKKINRIIYGILIAGLLVNWNCVAPEEPLDGLLEDIPAVVNTANVFSFNLKGNNYTFEEDYALNLNLDSADVLTTSLAVTSWSGNDTTLITIYNSTDSTLQWFRIAGNGTFSDQRFMSENSDFYPKKVSLTGVEFFGTLQFSLLKD